MVSDVEHRAVTAASAVAAAYGLAIDEAVVIHSGSNVLVHLLPAPVVARVMTGTLVLHDDPSKWLAREISVLAFLEPSGLAVVPSPLIAPGPYQHSGLWMTFAEWIPNVEATVIRPDGAPRLGRALRELHDALKPFMGDLGNMQDLRDDIERLLAQLRPNDERQADKIASLRTRLGALREMVFESTLPAQALHGDVSLSNLLQTPNRTVWNDFEDTFRGPVHWDVASFVGSLRARGATKGFIKETLIAYGWADESELAPFSAAHSVYDEIWQMYDEQRHRSPRTGQ